MSAHISHTRFPSLARTQATLLARLAWRRFRTAYATALRAETSRRNLTRLDDHMLSDIGISRAQAAYEADRKPWHLV